MTITYDVIAQGTVVLEYWSGPVTRDDIVKHEHQHLSDPRIKPGASVLVDAKEAYCGITPEEVRDIVDSLYAAYPRPLNIRRCALLLNMQTYPLVRAYAKSADKYDISVIAFTFLSGACAWLGLDVQMVKSHLERIMKSRAALP
jgi:hypothetical protein